MVSRYCIRSKWLYPNNHRLGRQLQSLSLHDLLLDLFPCTTIATSSFTSYCSYYGCQNNSAHAGATDFRYAWYWGEPTQGGFGLALEIASGQIGVHYAQRGFVLGYNLQEQVR